MISLYHTSNPVNRDSILEQGLIPQISISQECHLGDKARNRVYFCLHNTFDSTYDDDRYLIQVPTLTLTDDPDVVGGVFTTKLVSPEYITLIHKGTGESTI